MTKPVGERVATLEAYYVEVNESLKHIKEEMQTANGTVKDLVKFKIQAQAIIAFMAFVVSVTAGTLLTLIVAKVL
ncbi:MAG: hypothetical protein V3U27_21435 [Candidatus Tectomicrobia bacterium]